MQFLCIVDNNEVMLYEKKINIFFIYLNNIYIFNTFEN